MGYAVGYSTTNAMKEYTPLEKLLAKVTELKSLETMNKICRNIYSNQKEEKFRRLNLSNNTIKKHLVEVDHCIGALVEIGWQYEGENRECLKFPSSKKISFDAVRKIETAIDLRKRDDEKGITTAIKRNAANSCKKRGKAVVASTATGSSTKEVTQGGHRVVSIATDNIARAPPPDEPDHTVAKKTMTNDVFSSAGTIPTSQSAESSVPLVRTEQNVNEPLADSAVAEPCAIDNEQHPSSDIEIPVSEEANEVVSVDPTPATTDVQ